MLNVFLLNISETEISTMALNSGETIPKASSERRYTFFS